MRTLVLGPPGVGRGICAATVAAEQALPLVSSGDALRASSGAAATAGVHLLEAALTGQTPPASYVADMIEVRLAEPDAANGWVMDGYPFDLEQATRLDRFLSIAAVDVSRVLYIDADDDYVIASLVKYGRSPDIAVHLRHRMAEYRQRIAPVLMHYGPRVTRIDAVT
ncbi:adenylate kinase [Nakamurella sp. UYEF19]|uniref:nucleoside monophosphate kinase n=1 Tax=Nakamurella sp. UYEF19 TaxID=1756392 RepID=UPI003399B123